MRRAFLASVACASCLSLPPADPTPTNSDASTELEAGAPANDAATSDGSSDDGGRVLPPPKPECDPSTQPSATGVFVSATGDDLLAGTRAGPVKTLAKAMALAKQQNASDVYVEEGVYGEEITIANAVTVHGGWKTSGASWSKDCSDGVVGRTILRSTSARAVTIKGFTGTAGLDTLTITTKGQADASQSTIAIFVSGASLEMSGVDVSAGAGGDGSTPATPPATGTSACSGLSDCITGAVGGPGGPGTAASAGHFDATGWVLGVATNGGPGSVGANGTSGGPGETRSPCVTSCGATPTCADGAMGESSAFPGRCGCGGLGGSGGGPGTSGGASVAVMLVGPGALGVASSNVTTSRGGSGAAGAVGGPGGAPSGGAAGMGGFCAGGCFYNSMQGVCYFTGSGLAGGSAGGTGGAGGQGGQGGGGSGGPSYGIVSVAGATTRIDMASVAFSVGAGGSGAGSAPAGSNGSSLTL